MSTIAVSSGEYVDFTPYTDSHGFLLHQGRYTTIDDSNAGITPFPNTQPASIDDQGEIVGSYQDGTYAVHGFLLNHGYEVEVDAPFAVATGMRWQHTS